MDQMDISITLIMRKTKSSESILTQTLMEMVCAPGAWTRAPRPTGRDARANERTNERKRANVCAIER